MRVLLFPLGIVKLLQYSKRVLAKEKQVCSTFKGLIEANLENIFVHSVKLVYFFWCTRYICEVSFYGKFDTVLEFSHYF